MLYGTPVNVYAAATSIPPLNGAYQAIGNANPACADFLGPYLYAGNLYMVIQNTGPAIEPQLVWIVKSTDGGATWTIQDSANSPVRSSGATQGGTTAGCFRSATSIYVVYSPNNASGPVGATIRFKAFDLTTGLWGAASAVGPKAFLIQSAYMRSDGSIIVVHNNDSVTGTLMFSTWKAGVWTGPIDATTTFPGGTTALGGAACVLDSSDVLHMIVPVTSGGVHSWAYQQVTLANALQNFASISAGLVNGGSGMNAFNSKPVIVGNQILFGLFDPAATIPVCLIGTGISGAPTWTVSANMDPAYDLRRSTPFALCFNASDSRVYGAATDADSTFTFGEVRIVSAPISNLVSGWRFVDSINVGSPFSPQFATPFPASTLGLPPYVIYLANPPDTVGGFSANQTAYVLSPLPIPIPATVYLNPASLVVAELPNPAKDC